MLRIEMLPAAEGDALWIEYGDPAAPRRILVDGGPARTYAALRSKVLAVPAGSRRFELVVATHIDTDHIDGLIRLLLDDLDVTIDDIWFNGYEQLTAVDDTLGAGEGEILGTLIKKRGLPWNDKFGGKAVIARTGFPSVDLADGMRATVVGPTRKALNDLLGDWKKTLEKEHWVAGDPATALAQLEKRSELKAPEPIPGLLDVLGDVDPSKANGASIAFILEDAEGKRLLLTGDSHSPVLTPQLQLLGNGGRVKVDAFKLPHHGSRNNVSVEMLDAVEPKRYLISSSGAKYKHPDAVAIERVLDRHKDSPGKPILSFNYRSVYNDVWADPEVQAQRSYVATYPEGIVIDV